MKRIVSLLLAVTTLASCGAALAQEEAPAEQPVQEQIEETVAEEPAAEEIAEEAAAEETAEEPAIEEEAAEPAEQEETPAEADAEAPADEEAVIAENGASEEPAAESACSGTCGEHVTWSYDGSTCVLTISGSGDMKDYDPNGSPDEDHLMPEWAKVTDPAPWDEYLVLSVVIEEGVTSIGDYAFYNCDDLKSVTIPASVTEIGEDAFCTCELTDVYIADAAAWCNMDFDRYMSEAYTLYLNGTPVTSLVIPDSVTSINRYAFDGCTSLTSVTIGAGVTEVNSAFNNCVNLASIEVDSRNTQYASEDGVLFNKDKTELITAPRAKSGDYAVPDGVTGIDAEAFCGCAGLTSVPIPVGVTEIGSNTFKGCTGLTSVTIPNSVTKIGNYAFLGCAGLTGVTIPDSVTEIGSNAFENCTSLTCVTIPDSVTSLGVAAFEGCTSLADVVISKNVPELRYTFAFCSSLTSVTIPDGVTSIGYSTFWNCTSLKSVTIPGSVTEIDEAAFNNCPALTDIYYGGTAQQWNSIFGTLGSCAIHCSDGDHVPAPTTGSGWVKDNYGTWYYFGADGTMYKEQWLQYNGSWYYLKEDGVMATDLTDTGRGTYDFDASGKMLSGWQKIGGTWYYFNNYMVTDQWLKYNGSWYYLGGDGVMATGLQEVDGKTYYFSDSGRMLSGWQKIDGTWYYFNNAMVTDQWLKYNGSWYYLGREGAMVTGLVRLGDYGSGYVEYNIEAYKAPDSVRYYYFSASGKMLTGWQKFQWQTEGNTWHYFNNYMLENQWVKYNGSWYYFDDNGAMVTGTVTTANGTVHRFASNGMWLGAA